MFSSSSPNSSPLRNRGLGQHRGLHKPLLSSPLSPTTQNTQLFRRKLYKSQGRGRIVSIRGITDTQKTLLRDRFKAQCLEQAKDNRAKAVREGRRSYKHGVNNDVFDTEGDAVMSNDEEYELLDDEIYSRVVLSETRRAQHAHRVSFERDIGSSIDPNMYDDMDTLEMELTGHISRCKSPCQPEDGFDDDLIQEYLAELQDIELKEMQERVVTGMVDLDKEDPSELEREFAAGQCEEQSSPSRSSYSHSVMSSPPFSPSRSAGPRSLEKSSSGCICPFCKTTRTSTSVACPHCITQYSLDDAQYFWLDPNTHSDMQDYRSHMPLAATMPNESGLGIVLLCSASSCDWCYAL